MIKIKRLIFCLLTFFFTTNLYASEDMTDKELMEFSKVFLDTLDLDDVSLVSNLVKLGVDHYTAERYVAFMPIAFGRVAINHVAKVKFSEQYYLKDDPKPVYFVFSDEPLYKAAFQLALKSYNRDDIMRKELFVAVAGRSAEVSAVDKALTANVNITGAEFKPVLFWGYTTLDKRMTH